MLQPKSKKKNERGHVSETRSQQYYKRKRKKNKKKDLESDMVKNERNENEEMIKNKKHATGEDDDLKSLEKTGRKDGHDKAKANGIEGWHDYEVQQEKQNVVNETRKIRK